ncbi:hypothetical protein RJT34_02890 [Clitoria ternatea]|uniref:Uncharacterized protein n=1 Tax=Clitoria ternatea TaxID=43366 RepID=A0AAN9KKP0_CLITE
MKCSNMSRGESSGGGHSSLHYLFGSDEKQPNQAPPPNTTLSLLPPYGTDINPPLAAPSPSTTQVVRSSHHLGNVLTDRPSTKVKSVPGGHSSLGYLFGDK